MLKFLDKEGSLHLFIGLLCVYKTISQKCGRSFYSFVRLKGA